MMRRLQSLVDWFTQTRDATAGLVSGFTEDFEFNQAEAAWQEALDTAVYQIQEIQDIESAKGKV